MPPSPIHRALWRRSALSLALFGALSCHKSPPPAFPPAEVSVIQTTARTVPQDYEYVGNVAASKSIAVRAQVSGVILDRAFVEGSQVQAGQVLYRIDQTIYEANWRGAKARVAEAEARLANAERNIDRLRPLLADNAVAKQDVDNAEAELLQSKAAVEDARAAVDQAKKNLDDTVVRAELSGKVGRELIERGSRVTGPGDVLTTIDVVDPIYVTFEPSAQQLLSWKRDPISARLVVAGGPLTVKAVLPDGSELPRAGKLAFIDPVLNQQTGTQQFRAQFDNPDHLLVPGQFVRAHLVGLQHKDAILVPQRAVLQQMGRQVVYVVVAGDTVRAREVRATSWTGNQWLIEAGLQAGDRVVVDGVQKTGPGRVVRPVALADSSMAASSVPAAGASR